MPYPLLFPLLLIVSLLYSLVIRIRNRFYDLSILKSSKVSAPVVAVGNITVGGTGKTPLVERLAQEALGRGRRCGVIARGYKGKLRDGVFLNDEGLQLMKAVPNLAVVQNPDRVAAAQEAIEKRKVDFIVADDAFQHRRLARDLDVVVIDATLPFGFNRILPAGLLREPLRGMKRADLFVLSRCDKVDEGRLAEIEKALKQWAAQTPIFRSAHKPKRLRTVDATREKDLHSLEGVRVFAFSGIAHHRAFEQTLVSLGIELAGCHAFPDHHEYSSADIRFLDKRARETKAEFMVTTSKDAAKLANFTEAGEVWVLDIDFTILEQEDAFWDLIFNKPNP